MEINNYNFEKFIVKKGRVPHKTVAITENILRLNKGLANEFNGFNRINLYYDKENKIIGFSPAVDKEGGNIRKLSMGGLSVTIRAFLTHFGIDHNDFPTQVPKEQDGMYLIFHK